MPVPIITTLASVEAAARVPRAEVTQPAAGQAQAGVPPTVVAPAEIGGPGGLEPTRYGDWERRGRCIDF